MENHRDECFTCCILEWTLSQLCMLLRVCITHLISSLLIKIASFYSIIKGVSAMFCEKTETHTSFMTVFILGICFVIGFCFSLLCLIYKLTFIYRKKSIPVPDFSTIWHHICFTGCPSMCIQGAKEDNLGAFLIHNYAIFELSSKLSLCVSSTDY